MGSVGWETETYFCLRIGFPTNIRSETEERDPDGVPTHGHEWYEGQKKILLIRRVGSDRYTRMV